MGNYRAYLSIALTVGAFAAVAAACDGSSSGSEFEDPILDGGEPDSGPSLVTDGSSFDSALPPVSCDPSLPDNFEPDWKPPTKEEVCEQSDLEKHYEECLEINRNTAQGGARCDAWKEANEACAECVERADNSGPIQIHRGGYYYTLNISGCLALERNEFGADQCPAATAASFKCQRDACDSCFEAPNAEYSDFVECQQRARDSVCSTYNGKIPATCESGYTGPDGGAYACMRQGDDEKTHFIRVESIFCGK